METVGRISRGRGLASSLHGSSSMVGRDVGPTLRQLRRQHSRQEKPPRLQETTAVTTSHPPATSARANDLSQTLAGPRTKVEPMAYAGSREISISPGV